jgi:hypothetical protein
MVRDWVTGRDWVMVRDWVTGRDWVMVRDWVTGQDLAIADKVAYTDSAVARVIVVGAVVVVVVGAAVVWVGERERGINRVTLLGQSY